jgi:hypothetical protein
MYFEETSQPIWFGDGKMSYYHLRIQVLKQDNAAYGFVYALNMGYVQSNGICEDLQNGQVEARKVFRMLASKDIEKHLGLKQN